jgi:hypothetical protein
MRTVSELESSLLGIAIRRAMKAGLASKAEDVTLILRINGHGKHHDGWTTNVSEDEWKKILALPLEGKWKKFVKALRVINNEPLTGAEVVALGISINGYPLFEEFNWLLKRSRLPFCLSAVGKLPWHRRESEGRYRLFKKPTG